MPPKAKSDSFKNIILSFIGAVALIAILAILFILPKAELVIVAAEGSQLLKDQILATPNGQEGLRASFWQSKKSGNQSYPATDSRERLARATGSIKIINESASDQILVRTTRFLSPDNILLRLNRTITVPRFSEIEADITAEEPGQSSELPSGVRLSIPGLSASRQEQVLALIKDDLTGGVKKVSVVSQADLDQAHESLLKELLEQIKVAHLSSLLESAAGSSDEPLETPQILTTHKILGTKAQAQAGEEVESFSFSLTLNVTGITYERAELEDIVRRDILTKLRAGEELVSIKNISTTLSEITHNPDGESSAIISVETTYDTIFEGAQGLLENYDLSALSEAEVGELFDKVPSLELKSFKLSPFWLKRIPENSARIKVILESKD